MSLAAVEVPTVLGDGTRMSQPSVAGFNVIVSSFAPFPTLSFAGLPPHTTAKELLELIVSRLRLSATAANSLKLTLPSGRNILGDPHLTICSLTPGHHETLFLQLGVQMLGGKGGFGSMLRAQGGKMSSQKASNNDSCRDLNGRRLSTIKEAKKLAAYLQAEPDRVRAMSERQRLKYEKLERMLGRTPKNSTDFVMAASRLEDAGDGLEVDGSGSPSEGEDQEGQDGSSSQASGGKVADRPIAPKPRAGIDASGSASSGNALARRKHKFDDHEYLEQSREIVENVRGAVASAMRKKKKKKTSPPSVASVQPASA